MSTKTPTNKQGRKQKPLPASHNVEDWAERMTTRFLRLPGMEQHKEKLPRELLVRLAWIAFHGENVVQPDGPDADKCWGVLRNALTSEFGYTISFLSTVRDFWEAERNPDRKEYVPPGQRVATPAAVEQFMRNPRYQEWFEHETFRTGEAPKHAAIAVFCSGVLRRKVTVGNVKKAFDRARRKSSASA